jgi:uncharacterized protein (TIGR03435 family)
LAFGQSTESRRAFEVASVRPTSHSTDRGPSFSVSGNRLTITKANLGFLIVYAYGTSGVRPVGGPSWTWSDRDEYDVEGIAEEAKRSPADLKLMLQALLADRFKLAVHRETRVIPVFVLTVARGGPKLGEAQPADDQPDRAFRMVRGHITAQKTSMARLADLLHMPESGMQVLDETRLAGLYAFTLDWNPDDLQHRRADDSRPSLFTALEEQLGLKLESVKRPIEHLVIDYAEKPAEN